MAQSGDPRFPGTATHVAFTTTATSGQYGPLLGTPQGPYQFTSTQFPDLMPVDAMCNSVGHQMGDEIEVGDEIIVLCERCGARLVLKTVPGGMNFQRIKALLTALAAGEELDEETLGSFLELKTQLEQELEALDLAVTMLAQAAEIVKAKSGLDPDVS